MQTPTSTAAAATATCSPPSTFSNVAKCIPLPFPPFHTTVQRNRVFDGAKCVRPDAVLDGTVGGGGDDWRADVAGLSGVLELERDGDEGVEMVVLLGFGGGLIGREEEPLF